MRVSAGATRARARTRIRPPRRERSRYPHELPAHASPTALWMMILLAPRLILKNALPLRLDRRIVGLPSGAIRSPRLVVKTGVFRESHAVVVAPPRAPSRS